MLIFAGISLSGLIGEKGLFKRTEDSAEKYREAKARETLETVLLTDGQYEKNTNAEYNEDDFLDELIKHEIPGSKVIGDVAIVDRYGYELDRSVPKIGHYIGKEEEIVFPELELGTPQLSQNKITATFTATARENINGISKIEIWQTGTKKEIIECNNQKEVTITYTAKRNGKYYVKAYTNKTNITITKTTRVEGIVPSVEFSPNGSKEWKKEHLTQITVKETGEKVKSLKYKWTNSVNPPGEGDFSSAESCNNNDTITGKDFTGTYYLWVLLTTEKGKTNICGSEGFYFDNQGPIVTLDSTPLSETSFVLTATSSDDKSGIAKYEFYVDGIKVDTQTTTEGIATYTWNGAKMEENKQCYVNVSDALENTNRADKIGQTLLHTWKIYEGIKTTKYTNFYWRESKDVWTGYRDDWRGYTAEPKLNPDTGAVIPQGNLVYINKANMATYGKLYQDRGGNWTLYIVEKNYGYPSNPAASVSYKMYPGSKQSTDSWAKGEYKRTIKSSNRDAYPDDDRSGSNYYTYDGIK